MASNINTNLTYTHPQSGLVHSLRVIPQATLLFVDRRTARAISLTCTYVQEFFRSEQIRKLFCGLHFPLYVPLRDANGQLLCSYSESYARLTAAHSGKPGIVKSSTITCKGEVPLMGQVLTPDGKKVITCNYDSSLDEEMLSLYEIDTGECIWKVKSCPDIFEFSLDGKLIISDSTNGIIGSVNLETGEITRITEFREAINCMRISADGKYAYIGTRTEVKYLDLETGQWGETYFFPPTFAFASLLSINQDGTMALFFLNNEKCLAFWEIQTGKITRTCEGKLIRDAQIFLDRMRAVYLVPRQNIKSPYHIDILDLNAGKEVRSIPISIAARGVQGEKLVVTPDMRHAILKCSNGDLMLIDLELGRHVGTFNDSADTRILDLQIKADGTSAIYKTRSANNGTDTHIKAFNFCALPKERIANLARVCLSEPDRVMETLHLLPVFAQEEIRAILLQNKTFEKSVDIYKAIRMDLHPIRRLLRQAQREPHRAEELYSEAELALRELAPSIQQDVWRHFSNLQIKRGRSPNDALSNPRFAEIFKDGSLIEDGIEAITRTIAEYIALVKGQRSTTSSKSEGKEG